MMAELSPAAIAVDQALAACIQLSGEIIRARLLAAAALCAVADQVVPGQHDEVLIDSLHLSTRTENALKRHGVFTVGDLKAFTYADLLLIQGIGVAGADQVVEALSRIGVSMVRNAKGRGLNWQAEIARRQIRANLLAIAAELEGVNG